jgi:hypothetical protein
MTKISCIILIITLSHSLYSNPLSEDDLKNRSYKHYRNGLNEYNKENYSDALIELERSIKYRSTRKARKLTEDIRKKGISYYDSGVALLNFNKELAKQYLEKALPLIDPQDKKTREHINSLLKSL